MHGGEIEAIVLAHQTPGCVLLVDESLARDVAREVFGLEVRGTLGVLVAARRRGRIPQVRPFIDALLRSGEHLSRNAVAAALSSVGEDEP